MLGFILGEILLPMMSMEIDLLIYFCIKLKKLFPLIQANTGLLNLYNRQKELIRKKVILLHEDLQYDYGLELNSLND